MRKFIEDLELIDNGIAHIHNDCELKINITEDLILRIGFKKDEDEKAHRVDKQLNDERDLSILCVNFGNGLGEGLLTPIKLGKLDGKDMFVSLFVWTTDSSKGMRVLSYNIYRRN